MTTAQRLVAAATARLDADGEKAVTLRAVGHACGLSHNAPYKHFASRDALLAAVATADFVKLGRAFAIARRSATAPTAKLMKALGIVVKHSVKYPARYHLLFSNPGIAAQGGELKAAALAAFGEFTATVEECQAKQELPALPNNALIGLLLAAMHGLITLEASGRMHPEKGLTSVGHSLQLLVGLLSPSQGKMPPRRRTTKFAPAA